MNSKMTIVIFTPDNEPYLGRELLFHFDQLICSAMEQNAVIAPTSHGRSLTDHQSMACQVIAQALSLVGWAEPTTRDRKTTSLCKKTSV